MNYEKGNNTEIDLLEVLSALRRKILLIIFTTITGALIFGLYSYYRIVPTYQSDAMIYIVSGSTNSLVSLSDLQIGTSLTSDYVVLVKSRPVVEAVIKEMNLNMTYEELKKKISVTNKNDTRIIRISVTDTNPLLCQKIANTLANEAKKQIPITMQTSEPTIVEEAVEGIQVGPNTMRNTIIGGLLGFLLSAGYAVVVFMMDDSIKSVEDMERYLGLNVLAVIPDEGGTDGTEKSGKKSHKKKWRSVRSGKGGAH